MVSARRGSLVAKWESRGALGDRQIPDVDETAEELARKEAEMEERLNGGRQPTYDRALTREEAAAIRANRPVDVD